MSYLPTTNTGTPLRPDELEADHQSPPSPLGDSRIDHYNRPMYPHIPPGGGYIRPDQAYGYPYSHSHYDYPQSPTHSATATVTGTPDYLDPSGPVEAWDPYLYRGPPTTAGTWGRSSTVQPANPLTSASTESEEADRDSDPEDGDARTNGNNQAPSHKKFHCPKPGCSSSFARKADKDRHYECVHNKTGNKKFPCPEPGCSRVGDQCFTRKDHLTEHLRNYHRQQIPKRKNNRKSGDGDDEDQ